MASHIELLNKIPQHAQKSDAWLEQRKGYLTSSDAATALGINPYEKPVELLFKKCDAGKPFTGNIATRWGEKYEDEAVEMYCRAVGSKTNDFGLIPLNETFKLMDREPDYPGSTILAGSPDGIAINPDGELVLLEIKCPFKRKIILGYCPAYYYPQVQLNMYICGVTQADFIEYRPDTTGGDNYILNIVHYDINREWLSENVPKLGEFWKTVEKYRACGISTHPDYEKYKYPKEPKEPVLKVQKTNYLLDDE